MSEIPASLAPQDLSDIERALLGVLCVGLPPARAAGDDGFRVDQVTARILGLTAVRPNAIWKPIAHV